MSSDDQGQDTDEFTSDAELDQIAADADAIAASREGGRSNIVGTSSYDPQFTADNLEARGLPPQNFMSAANFAQTRQGGAGGDDTTSTPEDFIDSTAINVPTIQAAGTTPTFSGAGVSDVFDPMTMQARSDTMVEALGAAPTTTETRGTPSYTDFGDPTIVQSFLPAAVTVDRLAPQTKQERGLQAVANMFAQGRDRRAGMGDERGIDFGVTAPSIVGDDFGPALDMADRSNMANITETALGARTPGTRTTDQILADQSRMQQGQISSTTATGAEDPFDPDVGKPFDVERLEQMERLQQPTLLERSGIPSIFTALDPERMSRDRMATAIALGRPAGVIEGFTFTAPDMTKDKETIEEYNKRISARIPENQLIKDDSGMVVGIKNAAGRLVEGFDPNARMELGEGTESQEAKKRAPKTPDDPCPEGYKLIDGKCTIIEDPNEGTGFIRFPTDRDPPFQTGPFKPKSTPTPIVGIRGLNPITFNNPFRR